MCTSLMAEYVVLLLYKPCIIVLCVREREDREDREREQREERGERAERAETREEKEQRSERAYRRGKGRYRGHMGEQRKRGRRA